MHNHRATLSRRARYGTAVAVLSLASLLSACGGSSDSATTDSGDTTAASDQPADTGSGTDSGDTSETTAADTGSDVDICGAITQEDMAAILPEAELTTVAPNEFLDTPTCDYNITISGGGMELEAAVIQIHWNEPGFYDGQKELQSETAEVTGVPDAFAINDFGIVLVKTDSGAYTITRGVELDGGSGAPASQEQMTAIAALVAEL